MMTLAPCFNTYSISVGGPKKSWLEQERDVEVSRFTIAGTLKKRDWNRKELRRISMTQSDAFRDAFLQEMSNFEDRDLVFLDESIFNEKTGWRH